MEPSIINFSTKNFVGKARTMSFSQDQTNWLWQQFMPLRKTISHQVGSALYSIEVYDPLFFKEFSPGRKFEKWAAVEVDNIIGIPAEFRLMTIPGGLYAVFVHKGPASKGAATYRYIFENWLPSSGYQIDHRPHFAMMGSKYIHEDAMSEEEIWIPVQNVHADSDPATGL